LQERYSKHYMRGYQASNEIENTAVL